MFHSKMVSTGSAFPKKRVTNADIAKMVDTSDEWIVERTGIRARRIADVPGGECNTGFAFEAATAALTKAKMKATDIECIVYCTVTPDRPLPSASCMLQDKLGLRHIPAFDVAAACSGYVFGLSIADAFIKSGQYKSVLVVGAEVLSTYTNWTDRNLCVLFGDGAGCAILTRADAADKSRVLSTHIHADGSLQTLFYTEAGGSTKRIDEQVLKDGSHFMTMKGKEIFKEAVRTLADCAIEAIEANKFKPEDIDWFIPHQANNRIIEAVAKRLNFPLEKVIVNIDEYGNTSSATVPTAFDQAVTDGRIKRGDLVLVGVFGAGLTYGSALIRW